MTQEEKGLEIGFKDVLKANKKQIKSLSSGIAQKVKDGELDSIEAFAMAKKGKELFEDLEKQLRPHVHLNISKTETYVKNNVEFILAETGVGYDYSMCNHPRYNKLVEDIEKLQKEKKNLEEILKNIKGSMTIVDEESGEIIKLMPPIRISTDGFKATLK